MEIRLDLREYGLNLKTSLVSRWVGLLVTEWLIQWESAQSLVSVMLYLEIMEYYVLDSDKILVLASDGVWEFLSNKEVIELIAPYYERNSPSGAC